MVDTHCHLNILVRKFSEPDKVIHLSPEELLECKKFLDQAHACHVDTIINVGTNWAESILCIQIAQNFQNCYATVGLHPNDATQNWSDVMQKFQELLQNPANKIVGIGECGIDKHYPNFDSKIQTDAFHAQIQMALKHNLALSIHSRDADLETFQALADYRSEKNLRGVIHCFSSDLAYAQKYIELGFVLGFGGTVTYPKNEILRTVAKTVPLEKIILETDTPFLPPQSLRGQKNTPANIAIIAQYLAELRNENYETVAQTTRQTSYTLFGLAKE
jgi:TatD DNase family protein